MENFISYGGLAIVAAPKQLSLNLARLSALGSRNALEKVQDFML